MKASDSLKKGLRSVWKFWREEKFDLALGAVDRLLETRPDSAQLLLLRGELIQLQEPGDSAPPLDQAKDDLERAAGLDDRSPEVWLELAAFLWTFEDDAEGASRCYQKAIRLCREMLVQALVGRAETLNELGREDEAVTHLVEALDLESSGRKPAGQGVLKRVKLAPR